MKIERKVLPKSIIELTIEENIDNISKYRKKVINYLESNTEVKGFRKGSKIPENILIKQHGEEYINRMTIDFAIDDIYKQALKKEKIIPIAQAEIKEIVSESPLKIIIHIEILPEITIDSKYKDIKIKKVKVIVGDDEVENAINEIKTKFTKFEKVTDEKVQIKFGDRVTIDTDGYEGEKLLESTSMKDYQIIIGSNILVPGFEEGMIGAKLNDKLSLNIKFPDDYHNNDFKLKTTIFKITIKDIEEAIVPEFTPEFIEQLRGKKLDFEGFKKLIKNEILDTKETNTRLTEETKLIDELLNISNIDLGDNLIKNQTEKVYLEIKENLTKDGIKPVDYFESIKLSEEAYKEQHVQPVAIKRLHGELILHKLGELEKTEVSDEEMDTEIKKIFERFSSEDVIKKLKELYIPGNKYYEELKQRIIYKKLINSFLEE